MGSTPLIKTIKINNMPHIQPDTHLPKTPEIRIYSALLSQTGTAIPTAIVLHNTLGITPTFIRDSPGIYHMILNGLIPEDQFWGQISNNTGINYKYALGIASGDVVIESDFSTSPADDALMKTPIEIRYYKL